ncbi:lipid kinase [Microcoleus sp. FACHB-1515]|uniref:lipid kinase n=1 Tax=Cyanophyceae TaxID=3028117 RepID=UPI001685BC0C|nr:lipid kinase [Microcoleus sp. FACHB-1515]MBD2089570.1 lipid kinase [Microcoleus sp. FACHB-1515]
MSQRALLYVNQRARQGKQQLGEAVSRLETLGLEVLLVSAKSGEQLGEAIERHRSHIDLVIIGGGDGTLNAAVDSLVKHHLPLGILPLGTANDLARTLNLPTSISEACQVIARGKQRSIDLGWVNGKYFFNVASLGLSVKITKRLTKQVKQRWGVFAYAIAATQAIRQTHPFAAQIQIDGRETPVRTVQIAIGNGRYYGGGLAVAADAAIDDQRLDLYSLEIKNWWQMLRILPKMRQGEHTNFPWVRQLHGREITIQTRDRQQINTDGELTAYTPATFRVIPNAISVFVPESP